MRRANPFAYRPSHDFDWDRIHNFRWRVPLLAVTGRSIDLYQLREVRPIPEEHFYGLDIGFEAVAGQLEATFGSVSV
jgi:hypothetical protein